MLTHVNVAPDGITPYYYNAQTRESTYIRPSFPSFPRGTTPPTGSPAPGAAEEKKKKKKEKPKDKVPIPGTSWMRITTTEGNVFYFEKENKRSEWTVPDEIKEAVAQLEEEERKKKEEKEREEQEKIEQERIEKLKELERIRAEVEAERKKKEEAEKERKRKQREDGEDDAPEEKKAKVGDQEQQEDDVVGPEGEEDEEAWMKAVAAEFAEKDAQTKKDLEEQDEKTKDEEAEAAKKVFAVPEKVNVSVEEGRALFKALLIEKGISPFAPWEQSLPFFINDPRYVLLSSMKDRREVYEEYCREVGRAKRLKKASTAEEKKVEPEKEYKALLDKEVTSTRTRWDDFRKKWKKDRRFYAFGRDDHQREKVFKQHLRDLGEREYSDCLIIDSEITRGLQVNELQHRKPKKASTHFSKNHQTSPHPLNGLLSNAQSLPIRDTMLSVLLRCVKSCSTVIFVGFLQLRKRSQI